MFQMLIIAPDLLRLPILQCLQALLQLHRALAMVETLPDSQYRRRLELDVLVLLGKATIATGGNGEVAMSSMIRPARRQNPACAIVGPSMWASRSVGIGLILPMRKLGP